MRVHLMSGEMSQHQLPHLHAVWRREQHQIICDMWPVIFGGYFGGCGMLQTRKHEIAKKMDPMPGLHKNMHQGQCDTWNKNYHNCDTLPKPSELEWYFGWIKSPSVTKENKNYRYLWTICKNQWAQWSKNKFQRCDSWTSKILGEYMITSLIILFSRLKCNNSLK